MIVSIVIDMVRVLIDSNGFEFFYSKILVFYENS